MPETTRPFSDDLQAARGPDGRMRRNAHATVKATLTPDRPRRRARTATVETTEYAAMMRRMVRAYGRRVADCDVEDLAELISLEAILDEAIAHAVTSSRERWGRSWADIARATGTTRQAAQQRWGAERAA